MMLGATAVRLARPRVTAAALSTSNLSQLLLSKCTVSNNSPASALPSHSITTIAGPVISSSSVVHKDDVCMNNNLRWFSSEDKGDAADSGTSEPPPSSESISGSSQHDTWVEFQRSISVSGFDTGQVVKEKRLGKKNRGGKVDRKRKEREAEAIALLKGVDNTQLKGGEFPELRYSDEETERLLAEAYAAIPPRGGKRGTLRKKRNKRKTEIKMAYIRKKQAEKAASNIRKDEKKKSIADEVKAMRWDAKEVRTQENAYHNMVLQRWAETYGHNAQLLELEDKKKQELASAGWNVGEVASSSTEVTATTV